MIVADERDKAFEAAQRLGEAIPANPYRPPLFTTPISRATQELAGALKELASRSQSTTGENP
jgi:hypothetical protein